MKWQYLFVGTGNKDIKQEMEKTLNLQMLTAFTYVTLLIILFRLKHQRSNAVKEYHCLDFVSAAYIF